MAAWQVIALVLLTMWIVGFFVTLVALENDGPWYQRIFGWIVLFFIWPYIAAAMNTDI